MKWIVRLALMLLAILSPAAHAADGASVIVARWSNAEPPLDPASPVWLKHTPVPVVLYPQVSVPLSAPLAAAAEGTATLNVRALYDAKTLALHLEWTAPKPAKNRGIGEFPDVAAVQWPVQYGPGMRLPYIGMGDPEQPVVLWFWRADGTVETLAAEGFGTLTAQTPDGVQAKGAWKDGQWRVVFKRRLAITGEYCAHFDPAKQGLTPVALATWNGEAQERNGRKRLSAWHALRFEKGRADDAYVRRLAGSPVQGDPENGRRLMTEKGCAGCHAFPGNPAQPSIGPALTYAGGIHSTDYLLESLSDPSRVIVPGKKFALVQDGKRLSLMPPFAGTDAERRDVVTFLKTLR